MRLLTKEFLKARAREREDRARWYLERGMNPPDDCGIPVILEILALAREAPAEKDIVRDWRSK